ncbi:unnamed protein product [Rhizopus stolonifer]
MVQDKKVTLDKMKQQQDPTKSKLSSGYVGRFVSSIFGQVQEAVLLETEIEQLE